MVALDAAAVRITTTEGGGGCDAEAAVRACQVSKQTLTDRPVIADALREAVGKLHIEARLHDGDPEAAWVKRVDSSIHGFM